MSKKQAHHGGAWKVAYADFVTAMMALFMVLWICAQDKKILLATSRYFQSPFRSPLHANSGVMPYEKTTNESQEKRAGTTRAPARSRSPTATSRSSSASSTRWPPTSTGCSTSTQDLEEKPIDIQVTSDGLRITLFDRASQPLFEKDTAEFTPWGRFVMQNLAWLIDRHHFHVVDRRAHPRQVRVCHREDYTAWELSADRANASRRVLVHYAVDPGMIERVTGYADTRPLPGVPPESESNQRITLSLSLKPRDPRKGSAPSRRWRPRCAETGSSQPPINRSHEILPSGRKSAPVRRPGAARAAGPPQALAALGAHPRPSRRPAANIEVVKEGDKVVRLVVTCSCGERMEIECIYPAGAGGQD